MSVMLIPLRWSIPASGAPGHTARSHPEPGWRDDGNHPSVAGPSRYGNMRQGLLGFFMAASLLALLPGCTTPPASEGTGAAPGPAPASMRPVPRADVQPPASIAPLSDATLPSPAGDSELLAGEVSREFQQGKASWYGPRFNGRRTASGERYNMNELTAAHRTLPFGTMVRVRSLVNGKEVDVRITDRGPFSRGRVIDLSRAAAEAIGMLGLGVKDVLLLVPESTPAVALTPAPVPYRRANRRVPVSPAR